MIKKFFIFSFILLLFTLSSYASNPDIIVVPEKCLVNNSVYVIFQWRAPYAVDDFNVTVYSNAVKFENSTLYYAGIAEDAKILYIFKGKAIKPGNHTIEILMKYVINGAKITKKFYNNISILALQNPNPKIIYIYKNNTINESFNKNKTVNVNNISTTCMNISKINKTNKTMSNILNISNDENNTTKSGMNISKTIEKNEPKPKINNNTLNNTQVITNKNSENNIDYIIIILYGIFGLIVGLIFGYVLMYFIKL